jgi:hypothetical protein
VSFRARHLIVIPLLLGLVVPASAPAGGDDVDASALTASEITPDGARLSGAVAPAKGDTRWWIAYATPTRSYASTAPATIKGDGKHRPVAVSAVLTGLGEGVTVRAQLVAVSGDRRDNGPILTFATAGEPAPGTPAPADPTPGEPGPSEPAPAPGTEPAQPALPAPVQGAAVVAAPTEGTVRVRVPGSQAFVALDGAAAVPVGSVIDATAGVLALSTAVAGGNQQGEFWGARFQVRQAATGDGRTDLKLKGGSFAGCRRAARSVSALAARNPRKRKVRRLWGKDDGGRFRTHGRDSVATVRGTRWVTTDRCDGTVTKVLDGAVDVRNRHTGRVVRVEAGQRHFAKHRR